jgi:hypothetical protein
MLLKMALIEGIAGNLKLQLSRLDNILGVQEGYSCVPPGLLACVLKEKGAALVAYATTQTDSSVKTVSGLSPVPLELPLAVSVQIETVLTHSHLL